jgi:hypothetical protein
MLNKRRKSRGGFALEHLGHECADLRCRRRVAVGGIDVDDLEFRRAVESLVWSNAQQTAQEMHDPLRGASVSSETGPDARSGRGGFALEHLGHECADLRCRRRVAVGGIDLAIPQGRRVTSLEQCSTNGARDARSAPRCVRLERRVNKRWASKTARSVRVTPRMTTWTGIE